MALEKNYIVDPHILLYNPHALYSFEDNNICLPYYTLSELDKYKSTEGEIGDNARKVIKMLEDIQLRGDFAEGIPLGKRMGQIKIFSATLNIHGVYRDAMREYEVKDSSPEEKKQSQLIQLCFSQKSLDGKESILVTNQSVLRIKAKMLGLEAEEFTTDKTKSDYTGRAVIWMPDVFLDKLAKNGQAEYESGYQTVGTVKQMYQPQENEFLEIHSEVQPQKTLLGVYRKHMNCGTVFLVKPDTKWIQPKNAGQSFIQYALQEETIPLVIVKGPAGTGKTLLALAEGLHNMELQQSKRILICRPNAQFDDEIGFLPGTEQEKIGPLMRSISDNLEFLMETKRNQILRMSGCLDLNASIAMIMDSKIFSLEALNFIRGRSIHQTWIIVDEAQNLTPKQAKGIITRAGVGSKIILLGDPEQIDNCMLDEFRNGLTYSAVKMRGSSLCAQITMTEDECVRSDLAKEAAAKM